MTLQAAPQMEATTPEGTNPMQDKGKREIVDNIGGEQSFKMKEDANLMKAASAVEAKRKKRIQRENWTKREKYTLQETKLKQQEIKQKLKEEQELRRIEQEEKQNQEEEHREGALIEQTTLIKVEEKEQDQLASNNEGEHMHDHELAQQIE